MDEMKNQDVTLAQEAGEAAQETAKAAADALEAAGKAAADAATAVKDAADAAAQAAEDAAAAAADAAKEAAEAPAEAAAEKAEAPAPAAEDAPVETMDDYAAELEASFRRINEGDVLTGTVISVSESEVLVDFDYYTPAVIYLEDASDDPSFVLKEHITPGQTVTGTVTARDDGKGRIRLSMKEAAQLMAWDRLLALAGSNDNVTVKISGVTKAGAVAYLEGVRGFIPASKLALNYVEDEELPSWIGRSLEVRVITAEKEGRRLVMSAREILREKEALERKGRIAEVPVGLVTEGTVETIKPYGAFIDLGKGISGLLHVSQISQKRIKSPSAVLTEGQKVTVKVIDNKDGKISLSMKALEEAAPAETEEVHEEHFDLPESGPVGTSLGALFAKLKLDLGGDDK